MPRLRVYIIKSSESVLFSDIEDLKKSNKLLFQNSSKLRAGTLLFDMYSVIIKKLTLKAYFYN